MITLPIAQLCSSRLHIFRNGPLRYSKIPTENGFGILPPPVAKFLASSLPSIESLEAELSAGLAPAPDAPAAP